MDVITLLTEDHATVEELFQRYEAADASERDEIIGFVIHELSVHAAVEELFVYPAMRPKLGEGNDKADHAIEEHGEVKRLLADIEKSDPGSSERDQLMRQVIESVRHHVEEEEGELLGEFESATDEDTRERLGSVVEHAKVVAPTHPHPLVPGTATAQLAAGPWASVIDKVRDLFG